MKYTVDDVHPSGSRSLVQTYRHFFLSKLNWQYSDPGLFYVDLEAESNLSM